MGTIMQSKKGDDLPKERPKLSVCVSVYGRPKFVAQCLESIIQQECNFKFEIIVSDDCSPDGASDVIRDYESRYPDLLRGNYHPVNRGAGQNYLDLHDQAKGHYIAHIDGDDLMLAGKLQAQADFLDNNPDFAVVWHRASRLHSDGRMTFPAKRSENLSGVYELSDLLCFGSVAVHSSKMYRSELVSLTRSRIVHKYDYEIDLLQLEHGSGFVLGEVLGCYRISDGSLSSDPNSIWNQALVTILKERALVRGFSGSCAAANLLFMALISILKRKPGGWSSLRSLRKFLTFRSVLVFISTIGRRKRVIADTGGS